MPPLLAGILASCSLSRVRFLSVEGSPFFSKGRRSTRSVLVRARMALARAVAAARLRGRRAAGYTFFAAVSDSPPSSRWAPACRRRRRALRPACSLGDFTSPNALSARSRTRHPRSPQRRFLVLLRAFVVFVFAVKKASRRSRSDFHLFHNLGERYSNRFTQDDIRQRVERGFGLVDDHQPGAVLFGMQRE